MALLNPCTESFRHTAGGVWHLVSKLSDEEGLRKLCQIELPNVGLLLESIPPAHFVSGIWCVVWVEGLQEPKWTAI